ncbi:MAG: arginine--tRNA ligase [Alphaproteobacteria bacterium]|jgi:arginyl-tRNA synthetase|nr:arginine--tRNA ligase [Alphaproteobacteria bacterium]
MSSLAASISTRVADAFEAAGLPRELGQVRISDRPDLGQFQCNGAMAAAKIARQKPRAIAEDIVARLKQDDRFADVSIAGPGFINLSVTDTTLAAQANGVAADPRLGVPEKAAPETVVLDYGGPNIAKPMHVGHLRASIIGDSLRRLFAFAGDRTIGDVHMGDWGLPMGMLISELARRQPDLPYFEPGRTGEFPAESPVSMADLEALYPAAAAACKADPARLEAARAATAELQAGHPGFTALWRHFFDVSVAGMKRDFDRLGVQFDLWHGEAIVHPLVGPMVRDLGERGLAEESEGALVVRVARDDDRHEVPPLILTKSDGAVMYGTTDLATIIDRVRTYDPDLILYVVDQRQHLHFEQVFRAARAAGLHGKARLEHIGFGTMNGPDGKPFKTRAGGVMRLEDLLAMATEQAEQRLTEAGLAADYPAEERADIARKVGIAAVKFADLGNHRLSNYIFDLERFTRFEGRTGPYVLYAAVRISSLLRKAGERGMGEGGAGAILPPTDIERTLVLELCRLPDAVAAGYDKRAPNELCDYAYAVAQEFSRFYGACHILSESDDSLRASRLALCRVTRDALVLVLSLLGIAVPERM